MPFSFGNLYCGLNIKLWFKEWLSPKAQPLELLKSSLKLLGVKTSLCIIWDFISSKPLIPHKIFKILFSTLLIVCLSQIILLEIKFGTLSIIFIVSQLDGHNDESIELGQ